MENIVTEWLNTFESEDTKISYKYDIAKFQGWLNEYLPNVGRCLQTPRRSAVLVERRLSRQQVDRMLALATGEDKLLLKLLFYLGLRISEARRLKRSDIKSINGELVFGGLCLFP